MTDEQINIAIAEACGWVNCVTPHQDEYHFLSDAELGDAMGRAVGRRLPDGLREPIPNYRNDLNAMHEAEGYFKTATEQMRYAAKVLKVRGQGELFDENDLNVDHCWIARSATAHQCAEAFLRTLGKWEES
jgi:hypothetical protein